MNYDNAEPLQWGKNLGCDFVKRSCHEWMAKKEKAYVIQNYYALCIFTIYQGIFILQSKLTCYNIRGILRIFYLVEKHIFTRFATE